MVATSLFDLYFLFCIQQISFEFDVPDVLKEWGDASYIRFEFFNMPRNFGFRADDYVSKSNNSII